MKKVLVFATTALVGLFLATSCCNCGKDGKCCKNQENQEAQEEEFNEEDMPELDAQVRPRHGRGHGPHGGMRPGCQMEEMTPEMKEKCQKWMKFDSLSVEEQKALLLEKKAEIDKREAEIAAKKAEMEQKWANFEQLSIEEQKQLIEMKSFGGMMKMRPKRPMGDHHGAPHHGEGRHHTPHHNK